MASNETSSAPGTFPRGDTEIHNLARRLRARATSVLHDAPEQRTDLLQAADLIDILVHYRVQLRWLADEIADERTAVHLRHLIEGRPMTEPRKIRADLTAEERERAERIGDLTYKSHRCPDMRVEPYLPSKDQH